VVLSPDVVSCIDSRVDCRNLLQRSVIHHGAEREAASAVIAIPHSGRNDRNGMLRVYLAALPKIEAPALSASQFRPGLLYRPRALSHDLPMRGNNHPITFRCLSPLQRNLCRSTAFIAKAAACSSVCRLSRESDIHSRMIARRASCSGLIFNLVLRKPGFSPRQFRTPTECSNRFICRPWL
jgi:hypothetical protein